MTQTRHNVPSGSFLVRSLATSMRVAQCVQFRRSYSGFVGTNQSPLSNSYKLDRVLYSRETTAPDGVLAH